MRYIILMLLCVSCASKKQVIRRYVDEVIRERMQVETHVISNSKLNDNITISYRVNEYDTSGRILKETIAEVQKVKIEEKTDSVSTSIDTIKEVDIDVHEEVKEKRSRSLFWVGVCSGLLIVIAIYIAIKLRK